MMIAEIAVIKYVSENETKFTKRIRIPAKIHSFAWIPKAIFFPSLRVFFKAKCMGGISRFAERTAYN